MAGRVRSTHVSHSC